MHCGRPQEADQAEHDADRAQPVRDPQQRRDPGDDLAEASTMAICTAAEATS